MPITSRIARRSLAAFATASLLAIAGCAPGDVEFNGKIFDVLGVNGNAEKAKVKMADRQPLVVPPNVARLPQPGSAEQDQQIAAASFPVDPESRVVSKQAQLEQEQRAYCKERYEKAKAIGNHVEAATAKGPLGLCQSSILAGTGYDLDVKQQGKDPRKQQ